MNEIFSQACKLWVKIIACTIMAFFIVLSVTVIFTSLFTEKIGYRVYTVDENQKRDVLYTYYYTDGEDTKLKELEEKDISFKTEYIRSDLKGVGNVAYVVITQFLCLSLLIAFIYSQLKQLGNQDELNVNHKDYARDKLKGLKIGLLTTLPFFLFYLVHIFMALGINPNLSMAYYRLVNYIYHPVLNVILGDASATVGDLSICKFIILFIPHIVIPIVSQISYILGYKKIEFFANFIYQKKDRV